MSIKALPDIFGAIRILDPVRSARDLKATLRLKDSAGRLMLMGLCTICVGLLSFEIAPDWTYLSWFVICFGMIEVGLPARDYFRMKRMLPIEEVNARAAEAAIPALAMVEHGLALARKAAAASIRAAKDHTMLFPGERDYAIFALRNSDVYADTHPEGEQSHFCILWKTPHADGLFGAVVSVFEPNIESDLFRFEEVMVSVMVSHPSGACAYRFPPGSRDLGMMRPPGGWAANPGWHSEFVHARLFEAAALRQELPEWATHIPDGAFVQFLKYEEAAN